MSIDMLGTAADVFNTQPTGGVTLITRGPSYYDYDNGGILVEGAETSATVAACNIQPASKRSIEILVGLGGTDNPRDVRNVYINDGSTYLYPEDKDRGADELEFFDGLNTHRWRVMSSDNRPWHNYCHAIIERMRDAD